jgi:hypothetical protein
MPSLVQIDASILELQANIHTSNFNFKEEKVVLLGEQMRRRCRLIYITAFLKKTTLQLKNKIGNLCKLKY